MEQPGINPRSKWINKGLEGAAGRLLGFTLVYTVWLENNNVGEIIQYSSNDR